MFPGTHVYIVNKALGKRGVLFDLGTFIPDIASGTSRTFKVTHSKADEFRAYLEKKAPTFVDLADGIKTHIVVDELGDEHYRGGKGYAFQYVDKDLIDLVVKGCGIKRPEARKVAHNFPEFGIEYLVNSQHQGVLTQIKKALTSSQLQEVCEHYTAFYGGNSNVLYLELEVFSNILTENNLTTVKGLANLWKLINFARYKVIPDGDIVRQLILTSKSRVMSTYNDFLQSAIDEVKKTLK